jgi:hypothetical protein
MRLEIGRIFDQLNIHPSHLPAIDYSVISEDQALKIVEMYFVILRQQHRKLFEDNSRLLRYEWSTKLPFTSYKDVDGVTHTEYKTYDFSLKYSIRSKSYGIVFSVTRDGHLVCRSPLVNIPAFYKQKTLKCLSFLIQVIVDLINEQGEKNDTTKSNY